METPVRYVDRADIFTIKPFPNAKKKVDNRNSVRKKRFNPREDIKEVKMCRIKDADPVNYEVKNDSNEENVSFEQLQKSVQELILKSKENKSKPFQRKKARSVAFAFDERGHLMPREKEHMLNAQEMKEIQKLINDLTQDMKNSFNDKKPELTAKNYQIIYNKMKENAIPQIIEDYTARCPFVGKILNNMFDLMGNMLENTINMLLDLEKNSRNAMKQSLKDIGLFRQKITELANRPPVVVEKEVIVEKKLNNPIIDKTKELEQEIKTKEAQLKRLTYEKYLAVSAKEVWKSCSIELCKLSAPQTEILQKKQIKWMNTGQNYIDKIKSKTKELLNYSRLLTEHWNEKAVVVFTLCCKAQTSVLLHFKLIADKCAAYSQKIIRDYDTIMLDYLHDSTMKYNKYMLEDGELSKMSTDFQAWGPLIEEWAELENSINVMEARTVSLSLNSDMAMLINSLENYVFKKSIPEGIIPTLKSYLDRMEKISDVLTKPYNEQCRIVLTPLIKQIREIAEQTQLAIQGKPCKYLTVNGIVDSLAIRAISFKLSTFGKTLDHFVSEKTELLHTIQKMVPDLTYDIMGVNNQLTTPIENNITFLQQELDENSEIAQAWAIMYGSGSQGPFKLISQKSIGLDFISSFGSKMKKWISSIKEDFDLILSDGSYEEFELLLHDWFDSAEKLIHSTASFFYSVDVQTDPVIITDPNTLESKSKELLSASSSSTDVVLSLQRLATEHNFVLPTLVFTENFLLFEQDPNYDLQKKRLQTRTQSFSRMKSFFITPENPLQPAKPIPNARPQSWAYKIIKEFFTYRAKQSKSFERGGITYYVSNISAADSFKNFAIEKNGKKVNKDFLKQINDTLSNSKSDTDPLLYCAKLVKNGIWSRSTLDFMTSLFENVNNKTQINPLTFA